MERLSSAGTKFSSKECQGHRDSIWRGQASLAKAATQGFRGFFRTVYLDLDGLRRHYAVDPMSGDAASLSAEESKEFWAGIVHVAEYVSRKTWTRASGRATLNAERLWSPQSPRPRFHVCAAEFYQRPAGMAGLTHRPFRAHAAAPRGPASPSQFAVCDPYVSLNQ